MPSTTDVGGEAVELMLNEGHALLTPWMPQRLFVLSRCTFPVVPSGCVDVRISLTAGLAAELGRGPGFGLCRIGDN